MYPAVANSPLTELAQDIDGTQTTFDILDGSVLAEAPNLATIGMGEDSETILYGSKVGNTLSEITRGFQGTAKAWTTTESVCRLFTAYDYDALRSNIVATSKWEGISDKPTEFEPKAGSPYYQSKDDATTHSADIASQELNKGASLIGIHDTDNLFTATTVEGALKEVFHSGNSTKIATVDALLLIDPSLPITHESTWAEIELAIGKISVGFKSEEGETVLTRDGAEVTGLQFAPEYVILTVKTVGPNDLLGMIVMDKNKMPYHLGTTIYDNAIAYSGRKWSTGLSMEALSTDNVADNMTSEGFYVPYSTAITSGFRDKTLKWVAFGF